MTLREINKQTETRFKIIHEKIGDLEPVEALETLNKLISLISQLENTSKK